MRHPGNDIAIDPAVAVEQVPRGEGMLPRIFTRSIFAHLTEHKYSGG